MIYQQRVRISDNPMMFGKDLYIYRENPDGGVTVQYSDHEQVVARGESAKPTLHLEPHTLQLLADELQNLNIRPKEAGKTEGLYEAQSEHLKDLRKLLKL